MSLWPEGRAIVYCEGSFGNMNGKTAHGLVRRTRRYQVLSVVDSTLAGRDAGEALDGNPRNIPILSSITEALTASRRTGQPATHLVVGLAPDGGRLEPGHRGELLAGVRQGLNLDSGLHDFLSEDPEFREAAERAGVMIRDIRKPPDRRDLHFFSGKIEEVTSFRVAVLGTDSALGKRTTSWVLVEALESLGLRAEMVGTGQTAWMQGAGHGIVMDSLVNDFVAGEIEHAVWSCWKDLSPRIIVVEGQGGLMNPAYPGGLEILAAARPQAVIMQHAPARKEYDGFPGYPIHPLPRQIQAVEILSDRRVAAVTINHENLDPAGVEAVAREITRQTGLPAFDVLAGGAEGLARLVAGLARGETGI